MKIFTEDKLLAVWLTGDERANTDILAAIEPVVAAYGKLGYTTAVYSSGTENLAANTAALLQVANRAEMRSEG